MKRVFVDANVFLRFFSRDDETQSKRAERLFEAAKAGKVELVTGPPVLFEVAWVLRSRYRQSSETILDALTRLLAFRWLTLLDADLVDRAITIARFHGIDFADAYIQATADREKLDSVATFNRSDFEKMNATLYRL